MKIITIANSKGGVGKSNLALNISYCLAQHASVCTVDLDLQGSLTNFKDIVPMNLVSLDDLLKGVLKYEYCVIDTPPYLSSRLPEIIAMSDYVLLPVKPGFFDALAVRDTLKMLKGKRHAIVLSMAQHHTSLAREVMEILLSFQAPVLKTVIHQRVAYARSPITGSVFNSEDEKAKEEITMLTSEIMVSFLDDVINNFS